ncbi:MAG TPA: mechanosensitive ion channel domain-containing protein, partial [Lacipirellulaceae bacterium]|nr:mechanosensitive ion channel domain-containing protein [Lacipirellulaceae bacterium]
VQLAAASDEDPASPLPSDIVDEAVDLAALSEQTQKLVRTFLSITLAVGLVLIWGEILPALKYPAKQLLPGAETLTWGMLGAFLVILAVTFVSVRDVPALLELVILQHLPLDSGARYAFTSLSRYVLTAIGLTAAFNSVGIFWKDVQWLVAAMSVGLGFGLQEIFGNFVSGIILLFERPIRVGDVVTLGDKTGVVNRIRMRATTIVDPDRKEYIVPNKDLVTERLLNWTLTDYTNRVEIMVNVASGTDTEMACALLLEASREQPHVLADPQPSAVFEGYAEGGLKLALRCFLPNLDNRGSTIHALHTAIDRKFRAAGIEGAYGDMRIRLTREGAHGATQQSHLTFAAKTDEGRQGAA